MPIFGSGSIQEQSGSGQGTVGGQGTGEGGAGASGSAAAQRAGSVVTDRERIIILDRSAKTSPTYTRISQDQWGTGILQPNVLDFQMDTAVGSKKNIETTTIDETNLEVTLEGRADSLENNSNDLSELATWNTDGTPVIGMRAVFTARAKSNTKEFRYKIKHRILDP